MNDDAKNDVLARILSEGQATATAMRIRRDPAENVVPASFDRDAAVAGPRRVHVRNRTISEVVEIHATPAAVEGHNARCAAVACNVDAHAVVPRRDVGVQSVDLAPFAVVVRLPRKRVTSRRAGTGDVLVLAPPRACQLNRPCGFLAVAVAVQHDVAQCGILQNAGVGRDHALLCLREGARQRITMG